MTATVTSVNAVVTSAIEAGSLAQPLSGSGRSAEAAVATLGSSPLDVSGGSDDSGPFVLPRCEVPPAADFEPVEAFVHKTVLEQHQQPNDNLPLKPYKGMLDALRLRNDPALVTKLLLALRTSGNGATLGLLAGSSTKHARLVHNVVRFDPFVVSGSSGDAPDTTPQEPPSPNDTGEAVSYAIVDAHLHLLLALVSANSVYVLPILTVLWKLLALEYEGVPPERTQRLHAAIASILRLCPKGRSELFPIIAANAPYRTRPDAAIAWYYRHALTVLQYLPAIRPHVLEFVVDKCLELDVEIKIDDAGEVSIDVEPRDADGDVFAFDKDDDVEIAPTTPDVTVDEMANKLDSLMLMLFQYSGKESTQASVQSFYDIYARTFESSVLITHKSKFVQFLLFYVCGKDASALSANHSAALYRDFVAKLLELTFDPYRATVTRQTAACYLASFVSRASFVNIETVCESVSAVLHWAEQYLQSQNATLTRAADAKDQCAAHALFYTVCQAAFYIMCFRGPAAVAVARSAAASPASSPSVDLGPARWEAICGGPLQPLRYCLESVRTEFLQLSRAFGLLDTGTLDRLSCDDEEATTTVRCGSKPRRKSPAKITTAATLERERQTGGVGGLGVGGNPLESFFPFDPYLLRQSHVYIEPFYNHWPGSIQERMADARIDDGSALVEDSHDDAEGPASDLESSEDVSDDDDEEEEEEDQEVETDDVYDEDDDAVLEPMSLVSTAGDFQPAMSPDDMEGTIRSQQRQVWSAMLKRDRAPSLEHGSW